jgi:hypothetical protein
MRTLTVCKQDSEACVGVAKVKAKAILINQYSRTMHVHVSARQDELKISFERF